LLFQAEVALKSLRFADYDSVDMAELLRTLRLRDLAQLIVGNAIGSGIFLVPAQVLRQVHDSTVLAMLVWLGGVLALLGARPTASWLQRRRYRALDTGWA